VWLDEQTAPAAPAAPAAGKPKTKPQLFF